MHPRWVVLLMTAIMISTGLGSATRGRPGGAAYLPTFADLAIADLAERVGIAPERIWVHEVQARTLGPEQLRTCAGGQATRVPAHSVPVLGYRIALVANNAVYEYDGSRDCIVMAPRESRPSGLLADRADRRSVARPEEPEAIGHQAAATLRTSSRVASLEPLPIAGAASEAVRSGGSSPFAYSVPQEAAPHEGPDTLGGTDPMAQRFAFGPSPPHATLAGLWMVGAGAEQDEAARAWRAAAHDSFYRLHLGFQGAATEGSQPTR